MVVVDVVVVVPVVSPSGRGGRCRVPPPLNRGSTVAQGAPSCDQHLVDLDTFRNYSHARKARSRDDVLMSVCGAWNDAWREPNDGVRCARARGCGARPRGGTAGASAWRPATVRMNNVFNEYVRILLCFTE